MQNVVFSMKEYGHVEIQLKEIMPRNAGLREMPLQGYKYAF